MVKTQSSADAVRTIVVATDFSETAALAVDCAKTIARAHSAQLILLHGSSITPFLMGGPELISLPPDLDREIHEASVATMEELAAKTRGDGVEVKAIVKQSAGAKLVIETIEEYEADLAVTGTRGLTGFSHLLLGSTAEEIVQKAPCPVISVHPADADPIAKLGTVVVATDFSEDADQAVHALTRFFDARTAARLVLVHAYQIPPSLMPLAGHFDDGPVFFADVVERVREAIEPAAEALRSQGFEVETIVREGGASAVITDVAKSHSADLIAMGTRGLSGLKHLLLGSTAERVVQHASCPVLTVPRSSG